MTGLLDAEAGRLEDILDVAHRHYGKWVLQAGDMLSRRWLTKSQNPYLAEIEAIARTIGQPGVFLLNLSYEWSCTSGAGADPEQIETSRLLRTLDWPMQGLGRNLVVTLTEGVAGPYYNVTWPGFAGVLTAMAPGRFSASINQPPMRRRTPSCWVDWGLNRLRLDASRALPPVHLLRRVFDECDTFEQARQMLSEVPLSMPAFFTLSGIGSEEGCVIERTEDAVAETCASPYAAIANHWNAMKEKGMQRGIDSPGRLTQMQGALPDCANDFQWLTYPILNETTRVSVVASAARGHLLVCGWEPGGQATETLAITHPGY